MILFTAKGTPEVAYYLAPIANGLGDLIVSLPALQALIKQVSPRIW